MCQFFLILAIFSKKLLQFYGSTFFPGRYLTWNCDFPHRQLIHVFLYKKTVLKPFFYLALAVIFCLRPFCHRNLSRPKSLHIAPLVYYSVYWRLFKKLEGKFNLYVLENMQKSINFSLSYHSIGPSALVIEGVTKKCPVRNHNKIGDISEILWGRKITMADYCNLG